VTQGGSLTKPTGIGVAPDGLRLYLADQQAQSNAAPGAVGAILTVSAMGMPEPLTTLPGTRGRSPRALDVGSDVIYFTGTDPANNEPGLFQVPLAGGTVSTVAEGAPITSPDSVVVTAEGVAYITDQGAGPGQGKVFRVSGGNVTPVLANLRLGAPAGLTLINNDTTLLVSSIDATSGSDQLLYLDLATGKTAAATKVIGANMNSSGGLHRAFHASVLAWADVSRSGKVYRVDP
jgi:sugar lactone lactonase YvrE